MAGHWRAATPVPEFDAFGDPVSEDVAHAIAFPAQPGAQVRKARTVGAIVFWSLIIALLAGRISICERPLFQTADAPIERTGSF